MQTLQRVEFRHFHMFGAIGGGARGFNMATPRVGNLQGHYRCIGSIDVDAAANRDFARMTGVPATTLDMFDRDQYRAFWDKEPPADWREATAADVQRAAGGERPHVVFLSAPCKGFSGLLAESKSKTDKYQALNRLTLRGVWLMLEAWSDDPPELILFENVPRIATRGRHLLDQICDLLRAYGYAVAETTHDCGEIGGLAQSRKRFLLVARHMEKVPPFLYEPDKTSLRAVGDVLGRMPLPGDLRAGPMHRVPSLQWKTWVRLAFVKPGGDWRSLNDLAVANGHLRDYLVVPEMHAGVMGVRPWDAHVGTVTGNARPVTGAFSVADPRFSQSAKWNDGQALGVRRWTEHTGTVAGQQGPGQGAYSVADPRHGGPAKHSNEFRIVPWDDAACAVTSAHGSGQCVADPRRAGPSFGKYAVTPFDAPSGTVISGSTTGQGAFAVADPRQCHPQPSGDLPGGMPTADQKLVAMIRAIDGTWHRPFTTLELAALQSLVDPEDSWVPWQLDGESDQAWRERIGNAVPSLAAKSIAEVMGETLLLAMTGETFRLSAQPIWVRPLAIAISVDSSIEAV
ncbi:DNA cytosine methyltransferase [Hydrogenophaga aromaticivorans]|jgi:site-specific DNA-cytosine methylase|uniref:DNA cytosine methyltransferase n=1 Tax=Hydrogenophaga aromaticivorans TaxID=2610898 RepID=UPI001B39728D|nr:DNA cytosine methyltransferase [Hydrogenophaga aromaticivorans]MBQ0918327.1 DNA cytosine methyltransferase [Hydrogenophaga aromaticivorans]